MPRRLLIAALLIAALLPLLLLAGCAEPAYVAPAVYTENGSVEVYDAHGELLGAVTLAEIRALEGYQRDVEIFSSGEGKSRHLYRGARLRDVLNYIDPAWLDDYAYIRAVGADDYTALIEMDEASKENNAFIMYEDNGRALPMLSGEEGGMRLVLLDDSFGERYTRYLVHVILLKAEDMGG